MDAGWWLHPEKVAGPDWREIDLCRGCLYEDVPDDDPASDRRDSMSSSLPACGSMHFGRSAKKSGRGAVVNVLSDDELLTIVRAAEASGSKDDRTMDLIISWANRASSDAAILDLVLEGRAILDWNPTKKDIRVKLTDAEYRGRPDA